MRALPSFDSAALTHFLSKDGQFVSIGWETDSSGRPIFEIRSRVTSVCLQEDWRGVYHLGRLVLDNHNTICFMAGPQHAEKISASLEGRFFVFHGTMEDDRLLVSRIEPVEEWEALSRAGYEEIKAVLEPHAITFNGIDPDGTPNFVMPEGTPLMSQTHAKAAAGRVYGLLMSGLTSKTTRAFIEARTNFRMSTWSD